MDELPGEAKQMKISIRASLSVATALSVLFASGCDNAATTTSGHEKPGQAEAAPAAAAPQADAAAGEGAVIAKFGEDTFTEADLRTELDRLNRRSRQALDDPERLRQFVENHVLARLIFREGERRGFADDAEIERQVNDLKRRLVIQKVMQEHQSAPVTDEEVQAYYDAHPQEFTTDRVKASHILVKEEALAKDLHAQLSKDPAKFEDLAKEHSIDRSNSSKGGDLGFFGRGRMVKEFEEAAFALGEDGQISDPVQTRFGYHIIKRTGREDGKPKPFDEVKNQIRIRLINDKRREQTDQFLAGLKKDANLSIDEQAIAKVDVVTEGEDDAAEPEEPEMPHGH
jgi:peptidyl-prolyl cis-trans isomerase C